MLAGVDEAGRGCLAGPVVAAAVILPRKYDLPGLDDSKKLTPAQREVLEPAIRAQAVAWGLGVVWARDIDRINILNATFLAMARALAVMKRRPTRIEVDGNRIIPSHLLPFEGLGQKAIVDGDALVPAISAASVLAKANRDHIMRCLARRYPAYGLEEHKGYATAAHVRAIELAGPCRLHRLTFRGVLPERTAPQEEQQWLPGI